MIRLIKKGGLRERANRSRTYQGSENTETTLLANKYQITQKIKQHNTCENNTSKIEVISDEVHPTTTIAQK